MGDFLVNNQEVLDALLELNLQSEFLISLKLEVCIFYIHAVSIAEK